MQTINDGSPFLVLWYFFLAFFAVVLLVNVFCLLFAAIIKARIKRLKQQKRGRRR